MRVALVNNFFPPRPSGSAHFTDALAQTLAQQGHEVLVVTSAHGQPPGEEMQGAVRVVRLRSRSLPPMRLAMRYDVAFVTSFRNAKRLFAVLDDFAPDVLHQHGQFFDLTLLSAIWARRRHVPAVLTVHTALIHTTKLFAFILWLGDMVLVRPFLAIGRPTLVVIDHFIDQYVRRRYHPTAERRAAIPIAFDPERFQKVDASALRESLGLHGRPIVLSIGHVIPLRNRLALIEAMPHLLAKRPDVAVVVVGHVYDESFLRRAEALGVTDHLIVTGGVPRDDVPRYLSLADVEAHDFQGYGLGTASLEVMAAGVPVVGVVREDNFPGISLRSWENVVIVPPDDPEALADALVAVMEDPEAAARVAKGQQEMILNNFSIEQIAAKYVQLYETVAARRTGVGGAKAAPASGTPPLLP